MTDNADTRMCLTKSCCDEVVEARGAKKAVIADLARACGMSPWTIEKVLLGTYPAPVSILLRIAESLAVGLEQLGPVAPPSSSQPRRRRAPKQGDLQVYSQYIRDYLQDDGPPRTLYAAVTDGQFLRQILTDVEQDDASLLLTSANLAAIKLVHMDLALLADLVRLDYIDNNMPHVLQANLKAIENNQRVQRLEDGESQPIQGTPRIGVDRRQWQRLPEFWALLIDDMVMYGEWRVVHGGKLAPTTKAHIAYASDEGTAAYHRYSQRLRACFDEGLPNGDGSATV